MGESSSRLNGLIKNPHPTYPFSPPLLTFALDSVYSPHRDMSAYTLGILFLSILTFEMALDDMEICSLAAFCRIGGTFSKKI